MDNAAEGPVDCGLDPSFCPRLLKDPIQSRWLNSLPVADRKPICELSLALEDLAADQSLQEHLQVDTLVRFVRLRKLKAQAAEKDIRAYFDWRKTFNVDEVVKNFEGSEAERLYRKYSLKQRFGVDKYGLDVVYSPIGTSDPKAYSDLIGADNFFNAHIAEIEVRYKEARAVGRKSGICCFNFIEIIDQTGFEWGRATDAPAVFERVSKEFDKYYPLRQRAVMLLNSPWTFTAIMKICKLFISEESQQSLSTYGDDPKDWIVDLSKLVELDQIPKCFGGKSEVEWTLKRPPTKVDKSESIVVKKGQSKKDNK